MGGANGFCDTEQTKKCDKIAWQKIGEPKGLADFLSRLLWCLIKSDKILLRRNTPIALIYNTRWQFFLQSKQKFCLVRPAPYIMRFCYVLLISSKFETHAWACVMPLIHARTYSAWQGYNSSATLFSLLLELHFSTLWWVSARQREFTQVKQLI